MKCDDDETVAKRIWDLVLSDMQERPVTADYPSHELWKQVVKTGSELWLDSGDIDGAAPLWSREFKAFTTNNTLLNKEVAKGTYDELIEKTAKKLRHEFAAEKLPLEITFVLNARHALKLVHRFGSKVSVELHTDLANDVELSVAYGRRYFEIAPEFFYIKVPFTPAGLLAARRLRQEGIPVNCTLGFSARQNYVIAAIAEPAFVNVFLGRLNAFVADNELGTGDGVGERATLASQYEVKKMQEAGGNSRQIAASLRNADQVLALTGVDVLTMPLQVAKGFTELNPALHDIQNRTGTLPDVELNPAADPEAIGISALWDVPAEFKQVVQSLQQHNLDSMSAGNVQEFFADQGFADFLPEWAADDEQTVAEDGKIPIYAKWKARLAKREIGLDALMNISALHSFVTDQEKMDARVRSML